MRHSINIVADAPIGLNTLVQSLLDGVSLVFIVLTGQKIIVEET